MKEFSEKVFNLEKFGLQKVAEHWNKMIDPQALHIHWNYDINPEDGVGKYVLSHLPEGTVIHLESVLHVDKILEPARKLGRSDIKFECADFEDDEMLTP